MTGIKKRSFTVSIVVPAYNEERRITQTIKKIVQYLEEERIEAEIIVVNDGSTDNTANLINNLTVMHSYVHPIHLPANRGKGAAVRAGVLEASGEYILFSDADLATPIEEVAKLLTHLFDGYDIAIGSRKLPKSDILIRQPWYRRIMGALFQFSVKFLSVRGIQDTQCGFKCFRRKAAYQLFRHQQIDRFSFDVEVLYLARKYGYRVKEVPIRWLNSSESKVRIGRDSINMLFNLFRIRFNDLTGKYRNEV